MAHVSYTSLKKSRIETIEDKRVLGHLLSFGFDEGTGLIRSVVYTPEEKGRKHVLKGITINTLNEPIQIELLDGEESRTKLWIPNGQKVFTASNMFIGKLVDVLIDDEIMKLSFLDVAQKFLFVPIRKYLISRDNIISLSPSKIVVKDSVVLEKIAESYGAPPNVPIMENTSQSAEYDQ